MVQYVFTPWRSRRELLAVRRQFYPNGPDEPDGSGPDIAAHKRAAVARVSVWMQRGKCPHMVESTALLAAAGLSDAADSSAAAYAVRATYAAAFSRFVTGLLDGQQDRAHKLSMYSLARSVGLPASFVELRHQVTHESLPSLARLRAAASQALRWIWHYYWVRLGGRGPEAQAQTPAQAPEDPCRAALLRYVDETLSVLGPASSPADADALAPIVQTWGRARVLVALAGVSAATDNGVATDQSRARKMRCLRLSQVLWNAGGSAAPPTPAPAPAPTTVDLDSIRAQMAKNREALAQGKKEELPDAVDGQEEQPQDEDRSEHSAMAVDPPEQEPPAPAPRPRWTRYEGEWKPRPIGVV